ncbi:MAG: hypothetical protein WCT29_00670 [Candidatus Paceibacterota bacterium]|jgi:hypothetical protein
MFKNEKGETTLHIDTRLGELTTGEPNVNEEKLKQALKAYNLKEALLTLSELSKNIFNENIPEPFQKMGKTGMRHPAGLIIAQFAIEYLASVFIISGANDYKKESVKTKDNILGLFNIYNNSLIQPVFLGNHLSTLLIPMYFVQLRSQFSPQDLFTRQWMIFSEMRKKTNNIFEDINKIIFDNTNLTIEEISGISFSIFAYLIQNPLFNIGNLEGHTVESFKNLLTKEKIDSFLNLYTATYSQIRELDQKLNPIDLKEYTKARFNPLWKKPIIKLDENLFLAPSLTAYTTASFYGLFWWFDDYYREQSQKKQMDFRKYFGILFENYAGEVLSDLYGESSLRKQIKYGLKGKKIDFTDWVVIKNDKAYLFEVKAYQFPLEVLQKGKSDDVRKQVIKKIVESIKQIYQRSQDIPKHKELSEFNKKVIIPIVVFYDLPFISTSPSLYKDDILKALNGLDSKYNGIKDFKYYLMNIDELEDFYYCSDNIEIEDIFENIKDNPAKGVNSEIIIHIKDKSRKNFLDRQFNKYLDDLVPEL